MLLYSSFGISVHKCVTFDCECVLVCQCVPSLLCSRDHEMTRTAGLKSDTHFKDV